LGTKPHLQPQLLGHRYNFLPTHARTSVLDGVQGRAGHPGGISDVLLQAAHLPALRRDLLA